MQNFRNVDDSGWIDLDRVTAFVGRNESGKTSLLRALHKFNPATELAYAPQREFPRDRFQREFSADEPAPVCSVEFRIEGNLKERVATLVTSGPPPSAITFTRLYDGTLEYEFDPEVVTPPLTSAEVAEALDELASTLRRLTPPSDDTEGQFLKSRGELQTWITNTAKGLPTGELRTDAGRKALAAIEKAVEPFSNAWTADAIEGFLPKIKRLAAEAGTPDVAERIADLCEAALPVFIYFEDYGILDSAVYLPGFIADLARRPEDSKVRTINAMFTHVKLSAKEVHELGTDPFVAMKAEGKTPTPAQIGKEQERKELRAIQLNSASLDITERFSQWWHQRRHQLRYHADGDYFRIWIADDRRPGVEIELESRSKGFQWFFSFYLVFLVESEEGHRDAVLLLDEPGLHLHPTAQSELLTFFDQLAEKNQLIYTTHSPFLIDGKRLTRVRAVVEGDDGRSRVTTNFGPADRETLFPLQAALGYELAQTLFQGKRNVLAEGMTDLLYISGFDVLLRSNSRPGLAPDINITPSVGTKAMGILASIYIGAGARPLVLLDDDDAGRAKQKDLAKELYAGEEQRLMFVSSVVPGCSETEDVVGSDLVLAALGEVLGKTVAPSDADRATGPSVVDSIEGWAKRVGATLPLGWKLEVAWRIVRGWVEGKGLGDAAVLERGAALVAALNSRA